MKIIIFAILWRFKKKNYIKKILFRIDRLKYLRKQGMKIGENCRVYNDISGSEPYLVEIGDHVHIGTNVQLITHDGGVWVLRKMLNKPELDYFAEIKIGNNVFIGNNAIVLPGVNMGDNIVIGAGAVVTGNIESNSIYVGVPARKICSLDEYSEKILSKCISTKGLKISEKDKVIKEHLKNSN